MKLNENFFLFKNLNDDKVKSICERLGAPKSFKKGEKIYSTDNFSRALCIQLEGRAVAKRGEVVRRSFEKGDTFGAASLFGQSEEYATDIYAISDSTALFIYQNELEDIFAKYPACATNYITFLSEKIRFLNKKIDLFSAGSTAEKLYLYLSENEGKLNFSAVSRATGIGRTSLYRSLAELENSGLIERKNNIVKVISK
ncbi:MAG: Crp/Fnr family transcriptional regulator [Clostridiales bacterium]|nr:Crp/Fnr family transcriptional regulator [Candidatus Equinaster intestinalis]